jgi:hypothetical protein
LVVRCERNALAAQCTYFEGVKRIMRSTKTLVFSIVGLLAFSPVARTEESPKDLLERAYKAQGGFDKLAKLKATQVKGKGTIYLPVGEVAFTSEGAAQLPDKFKSTLQFEINGMKITQVQTLIGDKATILLNGNAQELDDNLRKEIKEQVYIEHVTSLVPLRESSFTLTGLGESKVDGQPAVGVKVTSKGHRDVSLYFDKNSALILKAAYQAFDPISGKEVAQEQFYRDYKEQDGTKHPTKSLVNQDGKKFMEIEVTDYKNLDKLDDSVFKP